MKEIEINHLVYLLKQAKKNNQPQPIFFLGAGASKTGNIPLAGEIIEHILMEYADSPFIQDLEEDKKTYANLMDCLTPDQRDELLKDYIEKAKINVTHIYLAQLLKAGYVDYVLTVNFDNLMLRALALFNIYPSTYDMAILKDLTTTTFKEKSIVYLHGQSHGLWLLNTPQEMEKVKTIVPRIFDSIKNKRPWIFIGYSGEDPIFEHIKNLGRFNNGLYWVTYHDHNPRNSVMDFLSMPNTNAFLIKGFDSDSFMLKLNSMLELEQPNIINKPFTALKDMLNEIVDIEDKDHFENVRERMTISLKQIDGAIELYEEGIIDKNKINTDVDLLKKEIINLIIDEKYEELMILDIESRARELNDEMLNSLLSDLYTNWGISLGNILDKKKGEEAEELYQQVFEKYQKAIEIKPNSYDTFYNWGTDLGNLAETKKGKEAEELYQQAFEKYQKAIEIKPDFYEAFYNWGADLSNLAKIKQGKEINQLYQQAFEKYQKAIEIKPDFYKTFYNWGTDLGNLAETKKGKEADRLYQQAFEKYQKVIEIKPDFYDTFYNWGTDLSNLAKTKQGREADQLYQQAFEKLLKTTELGYGFYNLACLLALREYKEQALHYLKLSLENKEITVGYVLEDSDWKLYYNDEDFIDIINKYIIVQ